MVPLQEWGVKIEDYQKTFQEWDEECSGSLSYQNFIKSAAVLIIPKYFEEYPNPILTKKTNVTNVMEQHNILCEKIKRLKYNFESLVDSDNDSIFLGDEGDKENTDMSMKIKKRL